MRGFLLNLFWYFPNDRIPLKDPDNFFLILFTAAFYLSTIAPSLDYRDSPEFIDTAFSLGISHPSGFPTYNLLVKVFTFLPIGSIAFKANLFSLVFTCLTLVFLFLSANLLLQVLFGQGESRIIAALFPVLLLAFSEPFWYQALVAEVYSLHSFFTCLIIYLLLKWKIKGDVRSLFACAFIYGLSSGNHGTVAFYLPAIVYLFLAWERKARFKNLVVSSLIFLMGFSVYLYLPIRSLAEPTIDWGNPQTLQTFFYHVTDRQHADSHFSQLLGQDSMEMEAEIFWLSSLGENTGHILKMLFLDLNLQLTLITVVGFLAGAVFCFKENRPLFFFFLIIVALNASFFVGWRNESYFPSHIVACLWTTVFLFQLLHSKLCTIGSSNHSNDLLNRLGGFHSPRQAAVILVLAGTLGWQISANYSRVDRSGNYFPESLLKRMVLSLEDNSIFVAGISWFNSAYHQDVMRLRDDVTMVKAWDFLDAHPPSLITSKKYPDLELPSPGDHRFDSREGSFIYATEFFDQNVRTRPVLIEQNLSFLQELPFFGKLVPDGNLLLRYPSKKRLKSDSLDPGRGFDEYRQWLKDELNLPRIQDDSRWIQKVSFYIPSFAAYFHSAGYYKEEREVLKVMHEFLGYGGPSWYFKMVDSLVLDGKLDEAWREWEIMKKALPELFETHFAEGLLLNKEGKLELALRSFRIAAEKRPERFRPYLEMAVTLMAAGDIKDSERALEQAGFRVTSLQELHQVRKRSQQLKSF